MKYYYIYTLIATIFSLPTIAQETYENTKLVSNDLNGTARYISMGGAMEALGAELSTINTNPAGIGLSRHNYFSITGGVINTKGAKTFFNEKTTIPSFDQIGFIISTRKRNNSILNFAFNYSKNKSFNYILNAANALNGSSQNKQSYGKALLGTESNGGFTIDKTKDGEYMGYENTKSSNVAWTFNQLDYLYWNAVIPNAKDGKFYNYEANSFVLNRENSGYIGSYDFNVSGSISNSIFWGSTFSYKNVNYTGYSEYNELLSKNLGTITVLDHRMITGGGIDISFGIIACPIEKSPFRIGLYFKTPTWFDLRTSNDTYIKNGTKQGGLHDTGQVSNNYDFKVWTPWRFGISLGHTIGKRIALGATYEYEDYSAINTRINKETVVDYYYGSTYETTDADKAMNRHTAQTLRGVSKIKIGFEIRPINMLYIRGGYNYISSLFNKNAQKNQHISSPGATYTSTTDFTNWDALHRLTFGVGVKVNNFNIDLAYQTSKENGLFFPFSTDNISVNGLSLHNNPKPTKIERVKKQFSLTIGYTF